MDNKVSAADLARRIDTPASYLSAIVSGTRGLGDELAEKIETEYSLGAGWFDRDGLPDEDELGRCVIKQYDVVASMGGGLVLKDQPGVIKQWDVSREWVEKNVPYFTSLDNLAIVTGFGDSMLGMFNPGDPLLVDRGITRCDVDGVYFFRVGDEGFIKRLQRIPGEGIVVISENQKYRDWTIKDGMDFQVLAKVLIAWDGQRL